MRRARLHWWVGRDESEFVDWLMRSNDCSAVEQTGVDWWHPGTQSQQESEEAAQQHQLQHLRTCSTLQLLQCPLPGEPLIDLDQESKHIIWWCRWPEFLRLVSLYFKEKFRPVIDWPLIFFRPLVQTLNSGPDFIFTDDGSILTVSKIQMYSSYTCYGRGIAGEIPNVSIVQLHQYTTVWIESTTQSPHPI